MKQIKCNVNKLTPLKVIDTTDTLTVQHTLFNLPWRMLLVGKSGSGKNSILSNLLMNDHYKYNKVFKGDNIYIFAPYPYEDYKMNLLIEYYDIQDNNIYSGEQPDLEGLENVYNGLIDEFKEDNTQKPLIIIDDYSSSGVFSKRYSPLVKIFCNCRKFNINIVFLSQYYLHTPPSIRMNSNILIIGNCSNKNLKLICDEHNYLKNDKMFYSMFRQQKEQYDFFTINYTNTADKLYLDSQFKPINQQKIKGGMDSYLIEEEEHEK